MQIKLKAYTQLINWLGLDKDINDFHLMDCLGYVDILVDNRSKTHQ